MRHFVFLAGLVVAIASVYLVDFLLASFPRAPRMDVLPDDRRDQRSNGQVPQVSHPAQVPAAATGTSPEMHPAADQSRSGRVPRTTSSLTKLNQDVLEFAMDHLGQQVGNGECWTLAAEALLAAGARPAQGYDLGNVIPLGEALPGDLLQFSSARFEHDGYRLTVGIPDHTAVVQRCEGATFTVLHQNVGGDKTVQVTRINFDHMKSGRVVVYRPAPRDGDSDSSHP